MNPRTPAARALGYIAEQRARHADRLRRSVHLCACGAEYAPTPDGRRHHRAVHGHTPCPPRPNGTAA